MALAFNSEGRGHLSPQEGLMGHPHPVDRISDYLQLEARRAADGRCACVTVRGELDSQTAPLLAEVVGHLLDEPPIGRVELDLAGLAFIDAAGIRCLLQCESAVDRTGAHFDVRDPTPETVRILHIVGLARHFGFDPFADGRPGGVPPRDPDQADELLAWSTRVRRTAHDTCRRAQDAMKRSSGLRDASS
jgi:anti-sigma B factor antagonist